MPTISKSSFIRGLQCHKSLYLHLFNPELRDETSDAQQRLFDTGHSVGEYAQQLFPGGIDASRGEHMNYAEAIAYTHELIDHGQEVIYEAAFGDGETLCYIDILAKKRGKWYAYEVKASTQIKDYHYYDAAFQYYVITRSGLKLSEISLVHLNNQYVRLGEIDVNELFITETITDAILPIQDEIPVQLELLQKMLNGGTVPHIDIGPHCSNPFDCDFMGYCWAHVPSYSVFNISRIGAKAFDLYYNGILKTTDIPDDYNLSDSQWMQVMADRTSESSRNQAKLNEFKAQLEFPLYFMDFETMMPAVPLHDNSRPYQQIPFQYSLHIQKTHHLTTSPPHQFYLGNPPEDPRPAFIKSLLSNLGTTGTILTYNSAFESARLREIASDFPEFAKQIEPILERIVDLMAPFRSRHLYTPEMRGTYSIKQVLPALVPELSYSNLEIQEGGTASVTYESLYYDTDPASFVKKREDLLRYCEMDTLSMVRILELL
jgi:hypothetical protein